MTHDYMAPFIQACEKLPINGHKTTLLSKIQIHLKYTDVYFLILEHLFLSDLAIFMHIIGNYHFALPTHMSI